MLLKAIRLNNFRQFIGKQEASFSTDLDKNVTIIMGGNGSGKTSLAQAFTWCLYGDTDFQDKSMLNHSVANNMLPKEKSSVSVELDLIHRDITYRIIREETYFSNETGQLKSERPKFYISYVAEDGQTEFIPEIQVNTEMRKILPKELSKYFFFDGERIDTMSKEIRIGKSSEFSDAVESLLGLDAIKEAIVHLKSTGNRKSVIQIYNHSYDAGADGEIDILTNQIEETENQLSKIDFQLEDIDKEEFIGNDRSHELITEISIHKDSEELAKRKEREKNRLKQLSDKKEKEIKIMLEEFNKNATDYFSIPLMSRALDILNNANELDKGVPELHSKTINYLLERKKCLCGSDLSVDSLLEKELRDLLKYVPPQSLGTMIFHFGDSCKLKNKSSSDMFRKIGDYYSSVRSFSNDHGEAEENIESIEKELRGMKSVGSLQQELRDVEARLRKLNQERSILHQDKGRLESDKKKGENERQRLVSQNEKNNEIERYKAYAEYLYQRLFEEYDEKESETREKLERTINEIFKEIYDGGFSLSIDDKYTIKVISDSHAGMRGEIETSTAQSISIIFAFIAGVIQLARDNNSEENGLLISEAYPLVMDAPLSSFDKTRIATVCEVLPQVAEQVIIFIKDTDGEIAETHMSHRIGKRYEFSKEKGNEFETHIEMRGNHV